MRIATVFPVISVAIFLTSSCGGGGESSGSSNAQTASGNTSGNNTSTNNTSGAGSSTPTQTNTAAVSNYITTRHTSLQPSFITAENTLSATLSAQGSFRSGAHYSRSADNYVAAVQSFLSDSVANAKSMSALLPVDSSSIASLLRTYESKDTNYVSTYYGGVNWGLSGSGLSSVINDIKARVNTAYDVAIASLP